MDKIDVNDNVSNAASSEKLANKNGNVSNAASGRIAENAEGNSPTEKLEKINRITSFSVDHNKITPGMYISRIDGDLITYDLRTRTPNGGDYIDDCTMHSVEHMLATFLRNSDIKDSVIYFGPMGCRTGFYLIVRDEISPKDVLAELKRALKKTVEHDGPVFGATRKECGNYECLDIMSAKKECERYLDVLCAKKNMNFEYYS